MEVGLKKNSHYAKDAFDIYIFLNGKVMIKMLIFGVLGPKSFSARRCVKHLRVSSLS